MFKSMTKSDVAAVLLRGGLAILFLYHGITKLSHNFGASWEVTLPVGMQVAVAWAEVLGGIVLGLGLLTRFIAAAMACFMLATGYIVSFVWAWQVGSVPYVARENYINFGSEYNIAVFVICIGVVILGGGMFSLDYYLVPFVKRVVSSARPVTIGVGPAVVPH
jgi:putative oxidoreductase